MSSHLILLNISILSSYNVFNFNKDLESRSSVNCVFATPSLSSSYQDVSNSNLPMFLGLIGHQSNLIAKSSEFARFPSSFSSWEFSNVNSDMSAMRPIIGANRRSLVKSSTTAGIAKINSQPEPFAPQIPIDQHLLQLSNSQSSSLLIPANSELNRRNQLALLQLVKQQVLSDSLSSLNTQYQNSSVSAQRNTRHYSSGTNLANFEHEHPSKLSTSQSFAGDANYSYFGSRLLFETCDNIQAPLQTHSELVKSSTISSFAAFNWESNYYFLFLFAFWNEFTFES